jgi:RNA recognition motif-containing protein
MNIYVGNLSYDTTDDELLSAFSDFGEVASAAVIKDKLSGNSRGFGFVEMPQKTEAQAAIQALNGQDLNGRKLTVNEARPREERPQFGGGSRDGGGGNRGGYNRDSGGGNRGGGFNRDRDSGGSGGNRRRW